jgi:homoserine O-acetyltransferase
MQAEVHHFHSSLPFSLESGESLPSLDIVYQSWGKLSAVQDNVIWICHAFTGSHEVDEWWQGLVGPGKLFNPESHFIMAVPDLCQLIR